MSNLILVKCECSAASVCPQGKTGSAEKCKIWVRDFSANFHEIINDISDACAVAQTKPRVGDSAERTFELYSDFIEKIEELAIYPDDPPAR